MIDHYKTLIESHRRSGILVDTNILLLYFLGAVDPSHIPTFKRTQQFVIEDYRTLTKVLALFSTVITTAHILTEVSNLSAQLKDPLRTRYFQTFAEAIKLLQEEQISSAIVATDSVFSRFGLTDVALYRVSRDGYLVLTDDFRLSQYLESKEIAVINFNHLRTFGWNT